MFRKLHDAGAPALTVWIDGVATPAEAGETVAAVLVRQANPVARTTPVNHSPRAPYCMMGACFECLAMVDDQASTQTCLITVRDGMRIDRQYHRRKVQS